MTNGEAVGAFEKAFAEYVGARYAIALVNGTATLHTALVAIGVRPGDRVAVPPLTMSATTIAVLQAGAVPVFCDVDQRTWLVKLPGNRTMEHMLSVPVSLYGLSGDWRGSLDIDDAAQTLREHSGCAFTSYSFQASKILPLGEGGMLVTNDEALAVRARSFSSLGYEMRADQPRIDPKVLKSPTFARHHTYPAWNYRMADVVAMRGLLKLKSADRYLAERRGCADIYRAAIQGCDWLTPQHVPEGFAHDYWCFPVLINDAGISLVKKGAIILGSTSTWERILYGEDAPSVRARFLQDLIAKHGGEVPYGAWRLTYREPAFQHLAPEVPCHVAEHLQPRLLQFQTNDLQSAEQNAKALKLAIEELS